MPTLNTVPFKVFHVHVCSFVYWKYINRARKCYNFLGTVKRALVNITVTCSEVIFTSYLYVFYSVNSGKDRYKTLYAYLNTTADSLTAYRNFGKGRGEGWNQMRFRCEKGKLQRARSQPYWKDILKKAK